MGGMSFSALNPMNWFSNETLTVSANGLGNITASTAVTEQAIERIWVAVSITDKEWKCNKAIL